MGNEQHDRGFRAPRDRLIVKYLCSLALAALLATSAFADGKESLIESWYAALQRADADRIGELLSPNAVIKLNDIGISQSKAEFIESLGDWKSAIEGGSIRHKPEGAVDGAFAYQVCYRFPNNELLTREVFTFEGEKIVSSDQTTISENCAGF